MNHYIHTHIHKYSDFLIVLISVGLAEARPNYIGDICSSQCHTSGAVHLTGIFPSLVADV